MCVCVCVHMSSPCWFVRADPVDPFTLIVDVAKIAKENATRRIDELQSVFSRSLKHATLDIGWKPT